MKLRAGCAKCNVDGKIDYRILTVNDDGIYVFTCPEGHTEVYQMNSFKFVMLFESGLQALNDKYYLESVMATAGALERFYEFAIFVLLKDNGKDFETIEKMYKDMSNLSERQVGAFSALYFNRFSIVANLLTSDQKKSRNAVIHKGKFPSSDDANNFAKIVFDLIKNDYSLMLSECGDSIKEYKEYQWVIGKAKGDKISADYGLQLGITNYPFTFESMQPDNINSLDFDTSIKAAAHLMFMPE